MQQASVLSVLTVLNCLVSTCVHDYRLPPPPTPAAPPVPRLLISVPPRGGVLSGWSLPTPCGLLTALDLNPPKERLTELPCDDPARRADSAPLRSSSSLFKGFTISRNSKYRLQLRKKNGDHQRGPGDREIRYTRHLLNFALSANHCSKI